MRAALVVLAVPVAFVVLTAGPAAQDAPTFRASADLVSVGVSVRKGGRPVMGLTAADFEVLDEGVPQTIRNLSFEKLPIDVTIALDISRSVTGRLLEQLRRGVQQLREDLGAQDRLRLLTFNMRVARAMDLAPGGGIADTAFEQIRATGSTALLDAAAVALAAEHPPDRRQLLVIFSDGVDSSSITEPNQLLNLARATTPTIDIVLAESPPGNGLTADALRPPQLTGRQAGGADDSLARMTTIQTFTRVLPYRRFYDQLARETGGQVIVTRPGTNLTSTFQKALEQFRSSYVLQFAPAGVEARGYHKLVVRVRRDGVDVRARAGYTWQ